MTFSTVRYTTNLILVWDMATESGCSVGAEFNINALLNLDWWTSFSSITKRKWLDRFPIFQTCTSVFPVVKSGYPTGNCTRLSNSLQDGSRVRYDFITKSDYQSFSSAGFRKYLKAVFAANHFSKIWTLTDDMSKFCVKKKANDSMIPGIGRQRMTNSISLHHFSCHQIILRNK